MKHATREINFKWVKRLFRDLTTEEKDLIYTSLGRLPLDASCGTLDALWARLAAPGTTLGLHVLPLPDGSGLAAATFYEVVILCDETKSFESLCTVQIGGAVQKLTDTDIPAMEQLARDLGCASIAMRTIRPGLAAIVTEVHGWFVAEIVLRKALN